ncbi:unnamed protein product, partial [Rangifer tarandus platyrhynchus]
STTSHVRSYPKPQQDYSSFVTIWPLAWPTSNTTPAPRHFGSLSHLACDPNTHPLPPPPPLQADTTFGTLQTLQPSVSGADSPWA